MISRLLVDWVQIASHQTLPPLPPTKTFSKNFSGVANFALGSWPVFLHALACVNVVHIGYSWLQATTALYLLHWKLLVYLQSAKVL